MKTLVAVYKLTSRDLKDHHQSSLSDVGRLLSLNSTEDKDIKRWSKIKLKILARNLYIRIVDYVIKCVNRFGAGRNNNKSPGSPISLFILNSFPPTTQNCKSNSLQNLLVNLHKETLRVI